MSTSIIIVNPPIPPSSGQLADAVEEAGGGVTGAGVVTAGVTIAGAVGAGVTTGVTTAGAVVAGVTTGVTTAGVVGAGGGIGLASTAKIVKWVTCTVATPGLTIVVVSAIHCPVAVSQYDITGEVFAGNKLGS